MKRLFIAINLPMELKRELGNVEKEISKDSQISKIIEDTEKIAKNQKPFEVKTKKICYDSDKQLPKLIWLTTNKGHITLARVKQWVFKNINPDERPNINQDFDTKFPVQSIELMESVLHRTGSEYKIIKSCPMKYSN